MGDMKFLSCFRPWFCELAEIWRSGTVSCFSQLCCSLWNTSELSSISEVHDSDSLSLIRPLLPAVIVALPSVVWWTLTAKALFTLILLRTVDGRLTYSHPLLAVELLTVNRLSSLPTESLAIDHTLYRTLLNQVFFEIVPSLLLTHAPPLVLNTHLYALFLISVCVCRCLLQSMQTILHLCLINSFRFLKESSSNKLKQWQRALTSHWQRCMLLKVRFF